MEAQTRGTRRGRRLVKWRALRWLAAMDVYTVLEYIVAIYCFMGCAIAVDTPDRGDAQKNETIAGNLLSRLLNKSDNRIRPNIFGAPVVIKCDLYVSSFGSVNAQTMDFMVDIYFRQKWMDPRLTFDEQDTPVILSPKLMDRVWLPDLFFPNEKTANIHSVMLANQAVKIFPNGTVRYSTRMTLRLSCPMVLTHFPMDYQTCFLKISSYAYTTDDLNLEWDGYDAVEMNRDELYLPQFTLGNVSLDTCHTAFKTGQFACLMAEFEMKREFGYYLLQAYIPSILIVIISWVSFWIHKTAVPARISLGVTTVLTMATQLQTAQGQVVSYARAIDVWYAFCMILVFSTLIEYAFVNSLCRSEAEAAKKRKEEEESKDDMELRDLSVENSNNSKEPTVLRVGSRTRSLWQIFKQNVWSSDGLDKCSRILFPFTFAVFNLFYWIAYTQKKIYVEAE